ncbi:phosphate/phosphite/phosphonate ABC transporter substrate-binding protein [Vibrio sp. 10N]|uniref:phosphate/phosphite/phosphonate ABC transporter substrate-binding protein n=1 Tax=Vibrio sp. 10N TaxID=3058938 RepID=UPI00281311E9|nr:phosphate/phosphite/phosphonate ABC transporter substrate-binding protein [Vibrio sp. 10N]
MRIRPVFNPLALRTLCPKSAAVKMLGIAAIGLSAIGFSGLSFASDTINVNNTTQAKNVTPNKTFTIGVLSNKARKHIGFTSPLAKYLGQTLAQFGYTQGRVKVTNSIVELGQWLDNGEIDMVSETLFSALKLQQEHNADILLRRWKKGQADYQTIFFARKNSGIHTLDDLIGKTLVLEDRSSTSGFYMPVQTLLNQQLPMTSQPSPTNNTHSSHVNIVVAGDVLRRADEISLSTWVAHGQADAGAFANTNWDDSGDMPPHIKPEMEIIHRTEFIPRSVILLRRDLPVQVSQAITESLVNAHQTAQGKAALYKFQKTTKFEAFSPAQLQSFEDYNRYRMQIEHLWFN